MTTTLGQLTFDPMSQQDAESIADWAYAPPYDFYDARADEDDLAHLLDPLRRAGRSFSARDDGGQLIGFFTFAREGDAVVVGLGLRPDHTGRGDGQAFVESGLAFGRATFERARFRLTVAEFNARAIAVYERVGFVRTRSFQHHTNGAWFPFIEMELAP